MRNVNDTSMDPLKQNSAFTMLELMVAIFIFSIVTTTVFGSFRYVFSNTESLTDDTGLSEMAGDCLNRMVVDLQNLYVALPPSFKIPEFNDDPEEYRFSGDTSEAGSDFGRLRFTSLAHLPFRQDKRRGIAEIVYYVTSVEDEGYVLRRADNLYPYPEEFEENAEDPILCEMLKKLTFTYIDHEGDENDSWNSDDEEYDYATPVAVEIELIVGDEESELTRITRVALPMRRLPIEK